MEKATIGVLAHVDAGKTTLCEAVLYTAGRLRKLGRVDHRDSVFDSHILERTRGITIFSKQADFDLGVRSFTLLDTPGHVDFVAETERTLPVLDAAVLVVSGSSGVQAHTETLWRLLKRYGVPTVIFVTKTDLFCPDRKDLLADLRKRLSPDILDLTDEKLPELSPALAEDLASMNEGLMESYLAGDDITSEDLKDLFASRAVYPVIFGSGLRLTGVDALLSVLCTVVPEPLYSDSFGARVYKITHDENGARVTHLKLTGGSLRIRDTVSYTDRDGGSISEKITGIRRYISEKYASLTEAAAGDVVAVTGLSSTYTGMGIGSCAGTVVPVEQPVMRYKVTPPDDTDLRVLASKLAVLEEEDPLLRISYSEKLAQLQIHIMGEIQIQVLESIIKDRFGIGVSISEGKVLYKETISNTVEGVGHFEPLRHYAEVHLLLEPGPPGSGIQVSSACHTDKLALNWQRLILYNLSEKQHVGVLAGYPLTDVRIILKSGRAHLKHTEGGDFREAALRAVRQGLMNADSVLLEPVYSYRITLPTSQAGRALGDIKLMSGDYEVETLEDGNSLITGHCPVSEMQGYASVVASYTGGRGSLSAIADGFRPCHDSERVIAEAAYDPVRDVANTPDSVFCRRGAGFNVRWDEVPKYMHLESVLKPDKGVQAEERRQGWNLDEKALEQIMEREFGPIKRRIYSPARTVYSADDTSEEDARKHHLIIDGYNVLFAWEETKALSAKSLDLARSRLMDILADYRGFTGDEILLVFDAYRSPDNSGKRFEHHGIEVVFTENGESADAYIERMANRIGRDDRVTVVSSDNLVRLGSFRSGVQRMSSQNLEDAVFRINRRISEIIDRQNLETGTRLGDILDEEELEEWLNRTRSSSEEQKT